MTRGSSCLARTQGSVPCSALPDPEDAARRGETPVRHPPPTAANPQDEFAQVLSTDELIDGS
jgi:hypothetical protein